MFLNSKSLNLKLIDFGLAMKWIGDLKLYLKKQRSCKPAGSVDEIILRYYTWLLNISAESIIKNVMCGL
jgi:hypothetical protein